MKVTLYNGDSYDATVYRRRRGLRYCRHQDRGHRSAQTVTLGNSDSLNVGDHVLAIGNPLGELTFSMSERYRLPP